MLWCDCVAGWWRTVGLGVGGWVTACSLAYDADELSQVAGGDASVSSGGSGALGDGSFPDGPSAGGSTGQGGAGGSGGGAVGGTTSGGGAPSGGGSSGFGAFGASGGSGGTGSGGTGAVGATGGSGGGGGSGGTTTPCGLSGQACCTTLPQCTATKTVCVPGTGTGTCQPCGASGQPCCNATDPCDGLRAQCCSGCGSNGDPLHCSCSFGYKTSGAGVCKVCCAVCKDNYKANIASDLTGTETCDGAGDTASKCTNHGGVDTVKTGWKLDCP